MDASVNTEIAHSLEKSGYTQPESETICDWRTIHTDQQVTLSAILARLNCYLQETYLEKLDRVILFGSQARGDAKKDSDIDVLIVLNENFDDHQESKRVSYFVSELCLEYDVVITCFFTSLGRWNTVNNGFFRNVRKEGIVL